MACQGSLRSLPCATRRTQQALPTISTGTHDETILSGSCSRDLVQLRSRAWCSFVRSVSYKYRDHCFLEGLDQGLLCGIAAVLGWRWIACTVGHTRDELRDEHAECEYGLEC